jgi:7-cyano-7-deazaguanine synthase
VQGLFVDYQQRARAQELLAAARVAAHLGIPLREVGVAGISPGFGKIPARNGVLLMLALMQFQAKCGVIALGIHAGTTFEDCSVRFVREVQRVFDLYSDGRIRVGAPFVNWHKRDLVHYYQYAALPSQLTYSCEEGGNIPCGCCLSCNDLEAVHAE